MWSGKVSLRHALVIVEQQFHNPNSRLFAALCGDGDRLRGFDEHARISMSIYNLLAALVSGLGSNVPPYRLPGMPEKEEGHLFAPTIREFNPDAFLRQLTQ